MIAYPPKAAKPQPIFVASFVASFVDSQTHAFFDKAQDKAREKGPAARGSQK
jgi:hypothetical protein